MKRKIYQTQHGRIILKIKTQHRDKYICEFKLSTKQQQTRFGFTANINVKWPVQQYTLKEQALFFKLFDQKKAEKVADYLFRTKIQKLIEKEETTS